MKVPQGFQEVGKMKGRGYLPELFRQIRNYFPELFRQIRSYLPELFRQIKTYLPEPVPANKNLFDGISVSKFPYVQYE